MSQNYNKKTKNKPLVHHETRDLKLNRYIIQEAHEAPWIGVRGQNIGSGLATPEDAPLC